MPHYLFYSLGGKKYRVVYFYKDCRLTNDAFEGSLNKCMKWIEKHADEKW